MVEVVGLWGFACFIQIGGHSLRHSATLQTMLRQAFKKKGYLFEAPHSLCALAKK
jgi:hypothetical protein